MTPVNLFDLPRERVSDRYEILRHGGGGAPTTITGGAVRFDHPVAYRLVTLLPKVITVDAWNSPELESIQSTLRLMAVEAQELRPGGEAVVTRLADIVVIQAIRSWMAQDPAAQTGWLGALQDKQIGRALALVHRDPSHPGRSNPWPTKSRCPVPHSPPASHRSSASRSCTMSRVGE